MLLSCGCKYYPLKAHIRFHFIFLFSEILISYTAGLIDSIMKQQLFLSVKATLLSVNLAFYKAIIISFLMAFAVSIILDKLADNSYCWAKGRVIM